mgnify:CR=1 FL=1
MYFSGPFLCWASHVFPSKIIVQYNLGLAQFRKNWSNPKKFIMPLTLQHITPQAILGLAQFWYIFKATCNVIILQPFIPAILFEAGWLAELVLTDCGLTKFLQTKNKRYCICMALLKYSRIVKKIELAYLVLHSNQTCNLLNGKISSPSPASPLAMTGWCKTSEHSKENKRYVTDRIQSTFKIKTKDTPVYYHSTYYYF